LANLVNLLDISFLLPKFPALIQTSNCIYQINFELVNIAQHFFGEIVTTFILLQLIQLPNCNSNLST